MMASNEPIGLLRLLEMLFRPPANAPPMNLLREFGHANEYDPARTFLALKAARHFRPADLDLREAEHAAFANDMYAGPWGGLRTATTVPAYSMAKWLSQNDVFLGPLIRAIAQQGLGHDLRESTPPSWREVQYGLLPFFGGSPSFTAEHYGP